MLTVPSGLRCGLESDVLRVHKPIGSVGSLAQTAHDPNIRPKQYAMPAPAPQ